MSRRPVDAETVGRDVLGPVVAEFCLRLWSIAQLVDEPESTTMLFCARGGLRMRWAFERFLAATELSAATPLASLMVSRVVTARGALVRSLEEDSAELLPAITTSLSYEFAHTSVREAARRITDVEVTGADPRWEAPLTPTGLVELLRHPDGAGCVEALRTQESLFAEHLRTQLAGRERALLIDTGFFGTTRELLAEGHPELELGSILLARSFRAGYDRHSRTAGLLVEADGYSPMRRRTSMMRNWHFIEWLFEPELTSVRTFGRVDGEVRSNLEVAGWQDAVPADPGSAFAGVLAYLDSLTPASAARVVIESDRAWGRLRRAIVWPTSADGEALVVGGRTHDFGRDDGWADRGWHGPIAALRGQTMWREGEIARSGSILRTPLLAGIESAYLIRHLHRRLRSR